MTYLICSSHQWNHRHRKSQSTPRPRRSSYQYIPVHQYQYIPVSWLNCLRKWIFLYPSISISASLYYFFIVLFMYPFISLSVSVYYLHHCIISVSLKLCICVVLFSLHLYLYVISIYSIIHYLDLVDFYNLLFRQMKIRQGRGWFWRNHVRRPCYSFQTSKLDIVAVSFFLTPLSDEIFSSIFTWLWQPITLV